MVFGQKVVWNALQNGQKQFGGIIDLCSQLVADVAADFIIKQGGWVCYPVLLYICILLYAKKSCNHH